ncbi:MAG: helix-turn-helix domain-containing protein [Clostridiales bacterium]|jgi:transcriptional regulator with XRE-family HTH domain|nr:helix-turn-helix domain-containing protein [Clostridiales bacterium]
MIREEMQKFDFGARLKRMRREQSLTQDELAARLEAWGCGTASKYTISQYENNRRFPGVKPLSVIAAFFGVSVDDLLGGTGGGEELEVLSLYRALDERGKLMVQAYARALRDVNAAPAQE